MILYSATKSDFRNDVTTNLIEDKITSLFKLKFGRRVGPSETQSWRNSLMYMSNILEDQEIPTDSHVAIEYKIPNTNNRIDFILSGQNAYRQNTVVIVELKQWTEIEATQKDAIVKTRLGGGWVETTHPSYQAWTYAATLSDFNSAIEDAEVTLAPCAYIHNCENGSVLKGSFYQEHTTKAPVFLKKDTQLLREFIKKHVKYGDSKDILYQIDNGKIRPSRHLAEKLSSMLKGNREFIMLDDQKIVFETAIQLSESTHAKQKNVLIVEGGPGSGKSVVAINLLVELTRREKTSKYVTKNAAPRAVYEQYLTGSFKKSHISNLFVGSGGFHNTDYNSFDALIVDEAHRLNEKSGLFSNLGENQIKELINSALFTVFFLDENQKVTLKDIGNKEEITRWAKKLKANIHHLTLDSQYRCNGSQAYIAWLDNLLQIKSTANETLTDLNYDFKVFNDPKELRSSIQELNKINDKSRIVAGYCWPWLSKKDPNKFDIVIGKNFKMQWNLTQDGSAWIIQPKSINQVGCIHTCQGLELDYVGVIIGPDFVIRNGVAMTDGFKRDKGDQSLKGMKSRIKVDPEKTKKEVDAIIKNTYKTLMTRGTKGCLVYSTDEETREYFKEMLELK